MSSDDQHGTTDGEADGDNERIGPDSDDGGEGPPTADTMVEGMQIQGETIDVERIPAREVPDGFPYEISTRDALALTLELTDPKEGTVTTYFGWPDEGTDERLGRLLSLRETPIDRFDDLVGDTVLLMVENGHFAPVLQDEGGRGDDRAYYGILAGLFPSILIFVAGIFNASGFLFTSTFVLLWVVATLVVLPVSIYYDAWNLRTTTNWNGTPLLWALLGVVPGLNVMTTAAYLVFRGSARPLILPDATS